MKKIRYYLAAFALVATLIGPVLLGMGAGAMANAVPGRHASSVSASFVAGKSTRSVASIHKGWCPIPGFDC